MRLLIVESPTKADALAGMLGAAFRVRATRGHVVDLPDGELGVDTGETFEGTWKTAKGQRNVLAGLRRDAAGCEQVLLATDPDREGEAIAHHLADALARTGVPTARVSFNEVTPEAVHAAVARPRRIDADLVAAQHARRVVDRLVGYAVSPVLQRTVSSPRPLSAGRVQTAALRLLCEREQALADFEPAERWSVEATFRTETGDTFPARLHRAYRQTLEPDTLDQGAAWHLVETAKQARFAVRSIRRTTETLKPPPPFTTAALIAAAEDLGLGPSETMRVAQQLYEGIEVEDDVRAGLLTYPRTDGVHMAKSAVTAVRHVIARDFGTAYLPPHPNRYARAGAGEPEAHEAIRPTDFGRSPKAIRKYLTPAQYRLYRLVYDRAVASQMAPATLERTTADVADAAGHFVFRAEGTCLRSRGFLQFERDRPAIPSLPEALAKGEAVQVHALTHARRLTTVPERYTEAGLVGAMEEHGIGRPSTYAATLATLRERGYTTVSDGHLHPTDLGHRACAFLVQRFPSLFDFEFTAQLESTLDAIAAGKTAYRPALHQFYHGGLLPALRTRPGAPTLSASHSSVPGPPAAPSCERCGRPMIRRNGPHGAFYGCSGFPDCRETRPYVDPARARRCPRCEQGWVVQRTTKGGRPFDGCSTYPVCDFAQWTAPPILDAGS